MPLHCRPGEDHAETSETNEEEEEEEQQVEEENINDNISSRAFWYKTYFYL